MFLFRRTRRMCVIVAYSLCQFLLGHQVVAQLTIYQNPGRTGASGTCVVSTIYTDATIPGNLNNAISSISLQQGYMAVLAENSNGTGHAYTFIAAVSDINVNLNPLLDDKVSFIRVLPFRNTKKKGAGLQVNSQIDLLNVDWFYDWGPNDVSLPSREYALMAWGRVAATDQARITGYINKPDVTHLLSFNEPDNIDQANIVESEAAALHANLAATGLRLGSPATTEDKVWTWQKTFMAATRAANTRVDYVAIHWYDWGNWNGTGQTAPNVTNLFNRFKDYVNRVYATYGKPIWITEFNANRNTTSATHEAFIALALPWLEAQPFVERYAYFFPPALPPVDANGNLTPIGTAYRNFSASTPAITRNYDNTELLTQNLNTNLEAETRAVLFGPTTSACATASGGQMVAAVTGNQRTAYHNVVVHTAGTYNIQLRYFSTTSRNITIATNYADGVTTTIPASGTQWCFQGGSPGSTMLSASLLPGLNTIEFTEAPIIDNIQLQSGTSLPMQLLYFNAVKKDQSAQLVWATTEERNAAYFEVLKSADGRNFETIGKVSALGTSSQTQAYQFLDPKPLIGTTYYKLKMVDEDASFKYSVVERIGYDASTKMRIAAIQSNQMQLVIHATQHEKAFITITSADGRTLQQQEVYLKQGVNSIHIPVQLPKQQVWLLRLATATNSEVLKFIH